MGDPERPFLESRVEGHRDEVTVPVAGGRIEQLFDLLRSDGLDLPPAGPGDVGRIGRVPREHLPLHGLFEGCVKDGVDQDDRPRAEPTFAVDSPVLEGLGVKLL